MSAVAWIVSLGSGASLAGYVALLIFAPQAALAIERIALDVLSRILSTRIGCATLALAAGLLVGELHGDGRGADRVQAEWDAAEHAAIDVGTQARAEAEREIAPVPADPIAPAPVKTETFHMPRIFNLRPPNVCPPVPQCPAAAGLRAVAPELRNDAHNRDHR